MAKRMACWCAWMYHVATMGGRVQQTEQTFSCSSWSGLHHMECVAVSLWCCKESHAMTTSTGRQLVHHATQHTAHSTREGERGACRLTFRLGCLLGHITSQGVGRARARRCGLRADLRKEEEYTGRVGLACRGCLGAGPVSQTGIALARRAVACMHVWVYLKWVLDESVS